MRKLAKSEQRLLIIFGAAVFLALNLFAIRFWMQNRNALLASISETRSAIATGESWINAAEALKPAREPAQASSTPSAVSPKNPVSSLSKKPFSPPKTPPPDRAPCSK